MAAHLRRRVCGVKCELDEHFAGIALAVVQGDPLIALAIGEHGSKDKMSLANQICVATLSIAGNAEVF